MPDEMEDTGAEVSDHLSENDEGSDHFVKDEDEKMADQMGADGTGEVKKKYDPKDPSRPRRKKARRACFACQRAHLTCGDERPCKRCIKRGLADACQDGVRKKAKYLHDAPPEALGPVLGPTYNQNPTPTRPNGHRHNSTHSDSTMSTTAAGSFLSQGTPATFPIYPSANQAQVGIPDGLPFNPQASPVSPSFQAAPTPMGNMVPATPMEFNASALFDPSNPALYNFDLEGLNFGSQYAGWEFGILNKMALGADTPSRENSISQTTPTAEPSYASVFGNGGGAGYDASGLGGGDFSSIDHSQTMYSQGNLQHGLPHAYAIAAGPTSLASPSTESTTSPQPGTGLEGSPNTTGFPVIPTVSVSKMKSKPDKANASILGKRQRDSASIYASVKEPYPYTAGFHNSISVLRERLPLSKLLQIARALGEIRPSFISCTKDLTREDLIFMEKCFQRTLVEFDDFLQHCCAPTIVCRRSGEVAAVNKEFTALTGWTKAVLLGKEPNRNSYIRPSPGQSIDENDSISGSGTTTPRRGGNLRPETSDGLPRSVFLAELLDDDSIVDFYRDFSQLAFEDSRGKVQRSGRLMKYRVSDEMDGKDVQAQKTPRGILSSRVTRIDGEHGISRIERDGKVNCTYCWTIKRDVFDIPMMIIINFLPRYYPNQEPHQLAV